MLLDDDPPSYRDPRTDDRRTRSTAFNRRSQQSEQLVARSLFTAGVTWPGVMLWDDLRTLDYLARVRKSMPRRLGCVGLSVGGYRSFLLAALDPRIKVAVDVGWMTSLRRADQTARHQHDRSHVPHRRPLPLSRSAGPGRADCAAIVAGHQRLERSAVPAGGRAGGVRRRSSSAFARRARRIVSAAASMTRRTSSTSRCRRRHGNGSNGGCESRQADTRTSTSFARDMRRRAKPSPVPIRARPSSRARRPLRRC